MPDLVDARGCIRNIKTAARQGAICPLGRAPRETARSRPEASNEASRRASASSRRTGSAVGRSKKTSVEMRGFEETLGRFAAHAVPPSGGSPSPPFLRSWCCRCP